MRLRADCGPVRIPHDWQADPFPGLGPYHGDGLEGLASGPALEARWGKPAHTLPPAHPAWSLTAHYLALGLVALICILMPQRLLMGGGGLHQEHLLTRVRQEVRQLLNNYIQVPALHAELDNSIVSPALGDQAGGLGALALAHAVRAQ